MTPDQQFWWNWGANVAVAEGTFAAAMAAIFGDWIKAHLFRPKLRLALINANGEKASVTLQWQTEEGVNHRTEDARYYRVRVTNESTWPKATQVQVCLVRLEQPGPDGNLQMKWSGELPIKWTHQEIYPLARTVGPPADCDLCSVVKGKWLAIHPMITPLNLQTERTGRTSLIASLQAKSNEGPSPIARFEIIWDGAWEDGEVEMGRHLIVREAAA